MLYLTCFEVSKVRLYRAVLRPPIPGQRRLFVGESVERTNRWTRTMASPCSSQWKRRNSVIIKYEAKMDAEAVVPFGNDLHSANGILKCESQCERRFSNRNYSVFSSVRNREKKKTLD
ncbi:hypothetical protein M513_06674 [Trichuris suis]|uniref:Uncharacterized protein n=1 Tax=Trichuris suis TaxID=68888 RepID=A0A085M5I1_9BILA|nr:hypothetical protein M513_06674 [Trichuris suis]